jgi:hypothetical protein
MSAITFELQVEALTGLTIASSSTNPTQTQLSTFLTDGATEIINLLPARLLDLCAASVSFTSGSASTLNTGKVLRVFRSDGDIKQPCRRVTAGNKGRYSDPEDMNYATIRGKRIILLMRCLLAVLALIQRSHILLSFIALVQ